MIEYYAGSVQSATRTWFEDDGMSPDSPNKADYQSVVMSAEHRSNVLALRFDVVGIRQPRVNVP